MSILSNSQGITGPRHSAGMVWGIGASAGMEAQVRALAGALNIPVEMKRISLCPSVAWLPNPCFVPFKYWLIPHALGHGSDRPSPPWPDLVISCGRRGAQAAMGLRARTGAATKFIHIQDPHVSAQNFDLVIAMEHDRIRGDNVMVMKHALHAVTQAALKEAAADFAANFTVYPAPRIAVLLGGSTNKYTLTESAMRQVIAALERVLANNGGSLLITPSRRTGDGNFARLRNTFSGNPRVYVYDYEAKGVNPYMGLLAISDAIIVSDDSVNMMSEAAATGKPLHLLHLPGHENTKPAQFAASLIKDGIARPLADRLVSWSYPVSDEMQRLAAEVRRRLF